MTVSLSACATYRPLPLPDAAPLHTSLDQLRHPGVTLGSKLSVAAIARLAVANDPALRAARARRGVAEAQLLAAGVLPNPAVSLAATPVLAGPGTVTGWSAGLSEDVQALVTRPARTESARAAAAQVDASLLWQEWQVIGAARLLTVQLVEGARLHRLLSEARSLLAARYATTRRAVEEGNASLAVVSPDLAALTGIERQIDALDRQQQQRRHRLASLLGLTPSVPVPLSDRLHLPALAPATVRALLPSLPARRPDLVALRFGYRAQDARLRAAILAQFPRLTIGLVGASDTSDVRTFGPQVTIDLPVFDRNQGAIAIARATRRQLRAEYAARLAAASSEVRAMLADTALFEHQLRRAERTLAATDQVENAAAAAFRAGNLTERAYVDFVMARIEKRQQVLGLQQSLLEQRVAMATLIGAGMPPVSSPPAAEVRS